MFLCFCHVPVLRRFWRYACVCFHEHVVSFGNENENKQKKNKKYKQNMNFSSNLHICGRDKMQLPTQAWLDGWRQDQLKESQMRLLTLTTCCKENNPEIPWASSPTHNIACNLSQPYQPKLNRIKTGNWWQKIKNPQRHSDFSGQEMLMIRFHTVSCTSSFWPMMQWNFRGTCKWSTKIALANRCHVLRS